MQSEDKMVNREARKMSCFGEISNTTQPKTGMLASGSKTNCLISKMKLIQLGNCTCYLVQSKNLTKICVGSLTRLLPSHLEIVEWGIVREGFSVHY